MVGSLRFAHPTPSRRKSTSLPGIEATAVLSPLRLLAALKKRPAGAPALDFLTRIKYLVRALLSEGRQPVTLVGGAGCGARAPGLVSRAPGRPRDPALRTLRSVCREPAEPPEQGSLRRWQARPGVSAAATGSARKSPRWSAGRRARCLKARAVPQGAAEKGAAPPGAPPPLIACASARAAPAWREPTTSARPAK